jgi:hypothetical protein
MEGRGGIGLGGLGEIGDLLESDLVMGGFGGNFSRFGGSFRPLRDNGIEIRISNFNIVHLYL